MIIDKNFLTKQGELSLNLIKWALECNNTLAFLERDLKIDTEKSSEFFSVLIDDITQDEIDKCTDLIVDFCLNLKEFDLLIDYLKIASQGDDLLARLKKVKIFIINDKYEILVKYVQKEHIPITEMLSFETQERESLAFKTSGYKDESVCPTMKAISTTRGKDLKELCDKALQKASIYRTAIGVLIGTRQGFQDKIEKATTIKELDNINLNDFNLEIKGLRTKSGKLRK